jgi:LPPG:FO 2-phospho-L-lactate transferase
MWAVLSGGVGGARFAWGAARVVPAGELTVIVNTADDLIWHGLYIAPDLDTVLYTLAGLANPETGWGIAGDTTHALDALAHLGLATWFRVGDRDLATHLARSEWLAGGATYTEVARRLAAALGVAARVLPMSDQPVRTVVHTAEGDLEFQEYFVHRQAALPITGLTFAGAEAARPTPAVFEALAVAEGIIVAPSNPFVSIGPILALPGLRQALRRRQAPTVAVSPIVGGKALKGPAARMLAELGHDVSALGVARLYADFLDGFVLDRVDAGLASQIEALGLRVLVTDTVMRTLKDREALARQTLQFARRLAAG